MPTGIQIETDYSHQCPSIVFYSKLFPLIMCSRSASPIRTHPSPISTAAPCHRACTWIYTYYTGHLKLILRLSFDVDWHNINLSFVFIYFITMTRRSPSPSPASQSNSFSFFWISKRYFSILRKQIIYSSFELACRKNSCPMEFVNRSKWFERPEEKENRRNETKENGSERRIMLNLCVCVIKIWLLDFMCCHFLFAWHSRLNYCYFRIIFVCSMLQSEMSERSTDTSSLNALIHFMLFWSWI